MSRYAVPAILAALVLAACGGDDGGGNGGGDATPAQCREWQDDFDAAEVFGDTEAMIAADDKMQEGGCYG